MKIQIRGLICSLLLLFPIWAGVSGEKYTYDPGGRLTSVTFDDSVQIAYTYDPNGNIIFIGTGKGLVAVGEDRSDLPKTFTLSQNYPNPFNPSTAISYQLPASNLVTLKIFDILGREITTLVNEVKTPGEYSVQWDPQGQASGVYFYTLRAGDFVATRKLVLLR